MNPENIAKPEENDIASKLMTSEEYLVASEKLPDNKIYSFTIATPERDLQYIGFEHSRDPDDPMFDELEARFIAQKPTSVFVEGNQKANSGDREEMFAYLRTISREEAIREGGESFFSLWLAAQHSTPEQPIEVYSPEPEFKLEILAIEQEGFSQEDILSYHIYRGVSQYLQGGGTPDSSSFMGYLNPYLEEFAFLPNWGEERVQQLSSSIVGHIDLAAPHAYEDLSDPIPRKERSWAPSNAVAQKTSRLRDEYSVNQILERGGKNTLVVFGKTHAVMQEPALRYGLLEQAAQS